MSKYSAFERSSKPRRSPPAQVPIKVTNSSCLLCQNEDNDFMVQCDQCDLWFHYICVGVDDNVQHVDWKCHKCSVPELNIEKEPLKDHVALQSTNAETSTFQKCNTSVRKTSSRPPSTTGSYTARQRKLELAKLQEAHELKKKRDNEYLEKKYAILSVASDDDEESCNGSNYKERTAQWVEGHRNQDGLSQAYTQPQPTFHITTTAAEHNPAVSNTLNNIPLQLPTRPTTEVVYSQPFRSTTQPVNQQANFGSQIPIVSNAYPQIQHNYVPSSFPPAVSINSRLNNDQMAARQAMTKELPTFSGRPEEWPLFHSAFIGSTEACNFSNQENMIRLQRCLKGRALDAVRCRLMLPSSVPDVMETLRIMFGRPELVVHNLLTKLRNEPAPKQEKLESLVAFAFSVQNICATMEASGLLNHLSNPTLIQELTDKLPPQIKLNWAMFKQTLPTVSLSTFSNWLFQLAKAASDVTLTVLEPSSSTKSQGREKFQHSHISEDESTQPNKTVKKCKVCNKHNHEIKDCRTFANYNTSQRWKCVRDRKLCPRCLGGHNIQRCKDDGICGKDGCIKKHNPLLHNHKVNATSSSTTVENVVSCHNLQQQCSSTLFRIVPVKLTGNGMIIETFAFLDEGSSLTLIEEELANNLKLNGTPTSLCLKWTSDMVRTEEGSRRVSFEISSTHINAKKFHVSDARTVKRLSLPMQSLTKDIYKYAHLQRLPITIFRNASPKILIGIDNWQLGVPLRVKEGNWNDPVATKTRLGWVIHGKQNNQPDSNDIHHHHICECKDDENLHKLVKNFFSIESVGVKVTEINSESQEYRRAKELLISGTVRKDGYYETRLLWKANNIKLPESFEMARKRLLCLESRMDKDHKLKSNLLGQMKEYLLKGYANRLSTEEIKEKHPRTWYLPLFAVMNPNKPGKTKMVWDAAAKVNDISLNSTLLKDQICSMASLAYCNDSASDPLQFVVIYRKCSTKSILMKKIGIPSDFCGGIIKTRKSVFIT